VLTLRHAADFYRSKVERVSQADGKVSCVLNIPYGRKPGMTADWTASNEAQSKFWRAEHISGGDFKLTGSPVTEKDFGPDGVLRLWEYGVGDTVRQATSVSLRRAQDGTYALTADCAVTISLKGGSIETSADGVTWTAADTKREGEWATFTVPEGKAIAAPLLVRPELGARPVRPSM
jgi:hypothetical protein